MRANIYSTHANKWLSLIKTFHPPTGRGFAAIVFLSWCRVLDVLNDQDHDGARKSGGGRASRTQLHIWPHREETKSRPPGHSGGAAHPVVEMTGPYFPCRIAVLSADPLAYPSPARDASGPRGSSARSWAKILSHPERPALPKLFILRVCEVLMRHRDSRTPS